MPFHDNRLLADDSHVISCLSFFQKLGKMSQNVSSATVVIGALRVKGDRGKGSAVVFWCFYQRYFQTNTYSFLL